MSRIRKAFKIWNRKSKILVPIEDHLGTILFLAKNHSAVFDEFISLLIRYVCDESAETKIGEGYRDDICTAIRRFEEFLKSVAGKNNLTTATVPLQGVISSVTHEFTSTEEFYPEELNLRGRIASRDSKYWPARKLGSLLGNTRAESWITKALKRVYVLTERGPHRVLDIKKMRVGQGDILEVVPAIYKKGSFVKAYGYHADGTMHPLKVARDSNGAVLLSSISLDHAPAISLIVTSGRFPEFEKLIQGLTVDSKELRKEFDLINEMELYLLMELSENSAKGNRW